MKQTVVLCVVLLISGFTANAQETENRFRFSGSVEFTTKYLWRGQEYGEAPTFFPTLSYSISGFSVCATGAYTIDNSWREADFGLSYSYKGFKAK